MSVFHTHVPQEPRFNLLTAHQSAQRWKLQLRRTYLQPLQSSGSLPHTTEPTEHPSPFAALSSLPSPSPSLLPSPSLPPSSFLPLSSPPSLPSTFPFSSSASPSSPFSLLPSFLPPPGPPPIPRPAPPLPPSLLPPQPPSSSSASQLLWSPSSFINLQPGVARGGAVLLHRPSARPQGPPPQTPCQPQQMVLELVTFISAALEKVGRRRAWNPFSGAAAKPGLAVGP